LADMLEREDKIRAYLARVGSAGPTAVAEELGVLVATAFYTLRRMVREGVLVAVSGDYSLATGVAAVSTPADVIKLPSNPQRAAAVRIFELVQALREVQGLEGLAAVDVRLGDLHLCRAMERLRGVAPNQRGAGSA